LYPFERFTERAKKVLTLAQEEAERSHHSYIGTEHLLLGLLREGEGLAAKVLNNLGVEIGKVRQTIESVLGRNERIIIQQIIPTSRVKKVIEISFEEARRMGHNYVGTEHLLLALLADPDALAARVLAEAKVTRTGVEQQIPRSSPLRSPTDEAPPFTPRAADCIAKAVAEALQLGHNYVGTEHLLLALFADPETLAAKILTESGATYDNLRDRVIERLSGYTRPRL
jgi:ATP-dependent Clp protease ATP-binding subunit ClpA